MKLFMYEESQPIRIWKLRRRCTNNIAMKFLNVIIQLKLLNEDVKDCDSCKYYLNIGEKARKSGL